jgi:hypothetical protein
MITMIKIDREKSMYRWYAIGIQSTLMDGVAIIYGWGSLRSTFQQWHSIRVHSYQEAEMIVNRMVNKRQKRGYIFEHRTEKTG